MLGVLVFVILAMLVGVPLLRALGLALNPFWMFANYSRIKNNSERVSDFHDLTKVPQTIQTSIQLAPEEVPKPNIGVNISDKRN